MWSQQYFKTRGFILNGMWSPWLKLFNVLPKEKSFNNKHFTAFEWNEVKGNSSKGKLGCPRKKTSNTKSWKF